MAMGDARTGFEAFSLTGRETRGRWTFSTYERLPPTPLVVSLISNAFNGFPGSSYFPMVYPVKVRFMNGADEKERKVGDTVINQPMVSLPLKRSTLVGFRMRIEPVL